MGFTPDQKGGFTPDPAPAAPAYQPDATDIANRLAAHQEIPGIPDVVDAIRNMPSRLLPQLTNMIQQLGGNPFAQAAQSAPHVIHALSSPAQSAANVGNSLRNASGGNEGANLLAGGVVSAGTDLVGDAASAITAARAPIAAGDVERALAIAGYKRLPTKDPGSSLTARTGTGIVGERPLATQQTLNNQGVTDSLAHHDTGVPQEQELNPTTLQTARTNGPGKVYDALHQSLPSQMEQDDELRGAISSVGDTVSQLPKSPDVDLLKQTMLDKPIMSRDQLFANIQQARERAAATDATTPDGQSMRDAYRGVANAYEDYLTRQIQNNPNSPVTLADFQKARTQFAQSYGYQASLYGTSVDAGALANYYKGTDPAQLSGGTQLIVNQALRHPLETRFGPTTVEEEANNPVRSAVGPAIGATIGAAAHGPAGAAFGAGLGGAAAGGVDALLTRILGGSAERGGTLGARAPLDPRLANIFGTDQPPFEGLRPTPGRVGEPPSRQPPLPLAPGQGQTPGITPQPPPGLAFEPHQRPLFGPPAAGEAPETAIGPGPAPSRGGAPATAVPTAGITATPIEPKLGDIMPGQRGAVGEPVNIGPLRALQNQPQTYKNGPIEIPKGAAKKPGAANDKKFGPFRGNPQTLEDFLRENLGDNF